MLNLIIVSAGGELKEDRKHAGKKEEKGTETSHRHRSPSRTTGKSCLRFMLYNLIMIKCKLSLLGIGLTS